MQPSHIFLNCRELRP